MGEEGGQQGGVGHLAAIWYQRNICIIFCCLLSGGRLKIAADAICRIFIATWQAALEVKLANTSASLTLE